MDLLNNKNESGQRKSSQSSYSSYRDSMSAKKQQIRQRLQLAPNAPLSPTISSNLDADNIPAIDDGDVVVDSLNRSAPPHHQRTSVFTFQTNSNDIHDTTVTSNYYRQQLSSQESYTDRVDSIQLQQVPGSKSNTNAPAPSRRQHEAAVRRDEHESRVANSKRNISPSSLQNVQHQHKISEHTFTKHNENVRDNDVNRARSREPNKPVRKPHYSALLRAHDSIRLKSGVARPVRNRSSNIDDDEDNNDDEENNNNNSDGDESGPYGTCPRHNKSVQGTSTNERAIDVRRPAANLSTATDTTNQTHSKTKAYDGEQIYSAQRESRHSSEVRIVHVARSDQESSLGVTVRAEDGNIVVARIMAGGLVDRQGLLQAGDIILAVDGNEVYTPEQLQEQLRNSSNDVSLKIVPSFRDELPTLCVYLRAMFSYDPNEDTLLPCREVGVAFQQGDILEVVNQEDPNWWQARRVDSDNLQTGLIPSQELEERRRAFILPDFDYATKTSICGTKVSRKRKKEIYNIVQNSEFDRAELQLYEEVCRTPAFERRTLVLIGANGVGRQSLKARLIAFDPDRFGAPLPHTSRSPRDGEADGVRYHFVDDREEMAQDIVDGKYLEWGEYDGHFYGTKFDSIREVIGAGKMCILDCSATCLKVLKTPDYLPFVVFVGAPSLEQLRYLHEWNKGPSSNKNYSTLDRALSRQSRRARTLQSFAFDFFEEEDLQITIEESARLLRIYENYFDLILVNNNFEKTFEQLKDAVDALSTEPQWIPISWIYGS